MDISLPSTVPADGDDRRGRRRGGGSWIATTAASLSLLEATVGGGAARALPLNYAGSTTIGADVDPLWSSAWFSHAVDRRNGFGLSLQYLPAESSHEGHGGSDGRPGGHSMPGPGDFGPLKQPRSDGDPGSHAQQGDETFLLVEWTRLLHRWNFSGAQANVWLFGGVGTYRASGVSEQRLKVQARVVPATAAPKPGGPHRSTGQAPAGSRKALDLLPSPRAGSRGEQVVISIEQVTVPAEPSLRIAASPGMQFDIETTRLRLEGRGRLYLASGIQRSLLSATAGVGLTPARYHGVQPWLELQVRSMPGLIDGVELIPKLRLLQRRLVLEAGYSNHGMVVGGFTFTL